MKITDDYIAEKFSDPNTMILAADNATCDHINSFMTTCQTGNQKIYYANFLVTFDIDIIRISLKNVINGKLV